MIKENLNEWSQVNDFGLEINVAKIESYSNKQLFLNELMELENSLSTVAELITKPINVDSLDTSIIQFKVTDNVRKVMMVINTN